MTLFSLNDELPNVFEPTTCWLAPDSKIIGRVLIFPRVSIWFGAIIRGDNEEIQIGKGTNVQENSILHTDKGSPLKIGDGCTIGHASILHGCQIGDNSLIGMGSTVLNGAQVEANCIVGAGSLIVQNQRIPKGSLVVGRPGKIIRTLSKIEIDSNRRAAMVYMEKILAYRNSLHIIAEE
ncbi:MAG: gamma carbonic anhydrase family protein [Pseudomonadota bacterium]|nr:gamma carbonic anhydrase family protein [Pseudomonadota bacterium]